MRSDCRYGPYGPSPSSPPASGPSSQVRPSHARSLSTACSDSRVERAVSVSSTRMMNLPPFFFARSQLKSAVRAPPTCSEPVGDGAKRVRCCIVGWRARAVEARRVAEAAEACAPRMLAGKRRAPPYAALVHATSSITLRHSIGFGRSFGFTPRSQTRKPTRGPNQVEGLLWQFPL